MHRSRENGDEAMEDGEASLVEGAAWPTRHGLYGKTTLVHCKNPGYTNLIHDIRR